MSLLAMRTNLSRQSGHATSVWNSIEIIAVEDDLRFREFREMTRPLVVAWSDSQQASFYRMLEWLHC